MGLFRKRTPEEKWGIDWNNPELQPISGVSLQTYAQANRLPSTGGDNRPMQAERAGVSQQQWIEARLGWQARIASNVMVQNALQRIMDPDVTPMGAWDDRP